MSGLWRFLFGSDASGEPDDRAEDEDDDADDGPRESDAERLGAILRLREEYARLDDAALKAAARAADTAEKTIAATAAVADRVLGLRMFDEQLAGALALTEGAIVEMQTGEGKTLAAVPAVAWLAREHDSVHVLTANDYLAARDAAWMHAIYDWLGLTVGFVQQTHDAAARRAAYACDVTYATANEVGFDYLRDQLALAPAEQVQRPFGAAVIDEADSILIDEARNPLVIAGGLSEPAELARDADAAVRPLAPGEHFTIEQGRREVVLTDAGVAAVEGALDCGSLFDVDNLPLMTAVQDALHAHVLLKKDVDYLVQDGAVLSVDEHKGRIVHDRRWPAGLQTALEVKEGVDPRKQGRILGSVTVQSLVGLYPMLAGMTGTAATQADEFSEVYELAVATIPTHRPVIRVDHPDRLFATRAEKESAVVDAILAAHAEGIPVLVGTASVEESERLSQALTAKAPVSHHVLNARHEEAEAAIIARAGEAGAVTISTNMAGRGVDIRLGDGVAVRGGLLVIGTNRHESRRIDNQLRGRSGRQGDPGQSQFFVSREDPLMQRYAAEGSKAPDTPDGVQRRVEGETLSVRLYLRKYEKVVEVQRQMLQKRRQEILESDVPDRERVVALATIDELWSDYLAAVVEVRTAAIWGSFSGRSPSADFVKEVHAMFGELQRTIEEETAARLEGDTGSDSDEGLRQRGATWTYITTDQPFGSMTERAIRGIIRMVRRGLGR
jgi:preprotein translocase subunit SecA